jgi:hypothetical protein
MTLILTIVVSMADISYNENDTLNPALDECPAKNNLPSAYPSTQTPTLDNPSDGDNMYAHYVEYQVTAYVSDNSGFADIIYLELGLWDNTRTTEYVRFRYNEDTNLFTEEYDAGTYVSLNTGSSTATESGNDIDATFYFTVDWDFPDSTDLDARCYVIDVLNGTPVTAWYEVDWDVETRLDMSVGPTLDDGSGTPNRGDLDGSITASGTVTYLGGTIHPSSSDVDIFISASEYGTQTGPWEATNYEGVGGTYSVTVYADDVVGQDTFTFKAVEEGTGVGGTDLFLPSSFSETYIADQLIISITDPSDQRINIGENATGIIVSAIYDFDDTVFDGTLTLNDTTFDYGIVGRRGYTVSTASLGLHRVSLIGINDATYCIWDSLTVTITDPLDQRININTNASAIVVSAIYDYDGSPFDGSITLNNSQFLYGAAQIQYYTAQTVSGGVHGITAISSNDVTYCIWDRLVIDIQSTNSTPSNDQEVSFTLVVTFDYDNTLCTTYELIVGRNGSSWNSFSYANRSSFTDTSSNTAYDYSIFMIASESLYGITVFTSNTVSVAWSISVTSPTTTTTTTPSTTEEPPPIDLWEIITRLIPIIAGGFALAVTGYCAKVTVAKARSFRKLLSSSTVPSNFLDPTISSVESSLFESLQSFAHPIPLILTLCVGVCLSRRQSSLRDMIVKGDFTEKAVKSKILGSVQLIAESLKGETWDSASEDYKEFIEGLDRGRGRVAAWKESKTWKNISSDFDELMEGLDRNVVVNKFSVMGETFCDSIWGTVNIEELKSSANGSAVST